jgi:hypothetical protein
MHLMYMCMYIHITVTHSASVTPYPGICSPFVYQLIWTCPLASNFFSPHYIITHHYYLKIFILIDFHSEPIKVGCTMQRFPGSSCLLHFKILYFVILHLICIIVFWNVASWNVASWNAIMSYNASSVKNYNAASSLVRFVNKKIFFKYDKSSSVLPTTLAL